MAREVSIGRLLNRNCPACGGPLRLTRDEMTDELLVACDLCLYSEPAPEWYCQVLAGHPQLPGFEGGARW